VRGHSAKLQPTGEQAYRWKGGLVKHKGYVSVFLPSHPRASKTGYVRRSLLVIEEKLGRPLSGSEVVHHLNRVRDDDRPENLEVMASQAEHLAEHNRRRDAGTGSRTPATHCKHGHAMTPDNVSSGKVRPDREWMMRRCKTCARQRSLVAYYRKVGRPMPH